MARTKQAAAAKRRPTVGQKTRAVPGVGVPDGTTLGEENMVFEGELTPAEAREKKEGVSATGKGSGAVGRYKRTLVSRAISSFHFEKNGRFFVPSKLNNNWEDVVLMGYVAPLSPLESRDAVSAGYWQFAGFPVEVQYMAIRPTHIYIGTDECLAKGTIPVVCIESLDYEYASLHPAPLYHEHWKGFVSTFTYRHYRGKLWSDLKGTDPLPGWWSDPDTYPPYSAAIVRDEQGLEDITKPPALPAGPSKKGKSKAKSSSSSHPSKPGREAKTNSNSNDESPSGSGSNTNSDSDSTSSTNSTSGSHSNAGAGGGTKVATDSQPEPYKQPNSDPGSPPASNVPTSDAKTPGEPVNPLGAQPIPEADPVAEETPRGVPEVLANDTAVPESSTPSQGVSQRLSPETNAGQGVQPSMQVEDAAEQQQADSSARQPAQEVAETTKQATTRDLGGDAAPVGQSSVSQRQVKDPVGDQVANDRGGVSELSGQPPATGPIAVEKSLYEPSMPENVGHIGPDGSNALKRPREDDDTPFRPAPAPKPSRDAKEPSSDVESELDAEALLLLMPQIFTQDLERTVVSANDQPRDSPDDIRTKRCGWMSDRFSFVAAPCAARAGYTEWSNNTWPYDTWADEGLFGSVMSILLVPDLVIHQRQDLPVIALLELFAGAVVIPDSHRGYLQQRLVACISLWATKGMLASYTRQLWAYVMTTVKDWELEFALDPSPPGLPVFNRALFKRDLDASKNIQSPNSAEVLGGGAS